MSIRTAAEATNHPPEGPEREREAVRTVNEVLWSPSGYLSGGPARAYPHVMAVPRRLAALCAAIVAVLALGTGVALGANGAKAAPTLSVTEQIFADYALDHSIDGHYSATDLNSALAQARAEDPASFGDFEAAVSDKYDRDILGLDVSGPASADDGSLLPVPSAPGAHDQPPWPFLALTALAALLVVSGAGSSIYRRARR